MIYELRIYTANPGKMPALQARFRDHTCRLFEKHGITNVAYWTNWSVAATTSSGTSSATRISPLARPRGRHSSPTPSGSGIFAESEKDGPLVHHLENRMFSPTDFSPLA